MQLTEHFSLEELIASEVAARSGIDNTPSATIVSNLRVLAQGLERVRAAFGGKPIHVNSGYRCAALNAAIGGAGNSLHMQGLAADIVCPQVGEPLRRVSRDCRGRDRYGPDHPRIRAMVLRGICAAQREGSGRAPDDCHRRARVPDGPQSGCLGIDRKETRA
ncbi:MAG TPA: D-Ala-D-Ala carboxypeptidase family metallohydrolase [Candidatus Dormibacteraeota bacterium]|nr:D-Ala-D-Ala carboxypeptidase family metallohydrolase [Candidatus Dormibacteraeota bacterium]